MDDSSTADNGDDDLVPYYPFSSRNGSCCPCPSHIPRPWWSGQLISESARLKLWRDAEKQNQFTLNDYISSSEPLHIEGLSKSASAADARIK
jgi:hypothetical protein